MTPQKLILACILALTAIFAGLLLTGCESVSGVSVTTPDWVLSYDKATGVAIHVRPSSK